MSNVAIEQRPIPLVRRNDVESVLIDFRGESYHVVKDPLSLKYFHLQPTQYEVWYQLDGRRSVEAIRHHLARRFPMLALRGSDIQQLVTDLHEKGLTRSSRFDQGERLMRRQDETTRQAWIRALSSPFFIKLPAINPSRTVSVFAWMLGWAYTKTGFAIATAVIVASWMEAAVRFDSLRIAMPSLQAFFGWPNIVWLWIMIGVTKVIHEMGHAVACRRMGRQCHGIGFGLLVFSPTLYCDATDSWLCRNKWDRMIVSAGGMYVELFFGAVALFVWSHTHPGLMHSLALNVAAVSTVTTVLFNANPLIRFDGYYILSDWLEIPNLQEKSSRLLYRSMAWCLGITTEPDPSDPKTGQAWFVGYATLSFFYRWFIMVAILMTIYTMVQPYRIESLGWLWVGIVTGMTAMGIFRSWKNVSRTAKEGFFSPTRLVGTLVIATALFSAICLAPVPWRTTVVAQSELNNPGTVYARVEGQLAEILVRNGDSVRSGDPLMILSNPQLDDEQRELRLEIRRIQSEVESLQVLNEHSEYILKMQELARHKKQLDQLLPLTEALTIRAPNAGVVIEGPLRAEQNSDIHLPGWSGRPLSPANIGCTIPAGTIVAHVASNPLELMGVCYVDQSSRDDLGIGATILLRFDALPHDVFESQVAAVSPASLKSVPRSLSQRFGGRMATAPDSDGQEVAESGFYRVMAKLPDDERLVPHMRGRARFHARSRTLGNRFIRFLRSTFYFRL